MSNSVYLLYEFHDVILLRRSIPPTWRAITRVDRMAPHVTPRIMCCEYCRSFCVVCRTACWRPKCTIRGSRLLTCRLHLTATPTSKGMIIACQPSPVDDSTDTVAARLVVGLFPLRVRWNGTRFQTLSGTLLGAPTASNRRWKLIFLRRKGTISALEARRDALYKSTTTILLLLLPLPLPLFFVTDVRLYL